MDTIQFEIKGTMPLMLSTEPPFEAKPESTPAKQNKNTINDPAVVAASHLTLQPNGHGKKTIVIASHMLFKSLQSAVSIAKSDPASGFKRSPSPLQVVRGAVFLKPPYLVLEPHDWTIDARRAGNNGRGGGAMLYRPRFDKWGTAGQVDYDDRQISMETLRRLFDYAGMYAGLGAWRRGLGGPFGTFLVTKWETD